MKDLIEYLCFAYKADSKYNEFRTRVLKEDPEPEPVGNPIVIFVKKVVYKIKLLQKGYKPYKKLKKRKVLFNVVNKIIKK